jgi:hypothetical protein
VKHHSLLIRILTNNGFKIMRLITLTKNHIIMILVFVFNLYHYLIENRIVKWILGRLL